MGIGTSHQIAILLKDKGCVQLGRSRYNQLGSRMRGSQHCTRAHTGKWLASPAMRTKNIVCCDATATKPAVYGLRLHGFAAELWSWRSVADSSCNKFFEMAGENVVHLFGRTKTVLGFVFHRTH